MCGTVGIAGNLRRVDECCSCVNLGLERFQRCSRYVKLYDSSYGIRYSWERVEIGGRSREVIALQK